MFIIEFCFAGTSTDLLFEQVFLWPKFGHSLSHLREAARSG